LEGVYCINKDKPDTIIKVRVSVRITQLTHETYIVKIEIQTSFSAGGDIEWVSVSNGDIILSRKEMEN
jgi:hypothetical protein